MRKEFLERLEQILGEVYKESYYDTLNTSQLEALVDLLEEVELQKEEDMENYLEQMEQIRASGVTNMFDGVYVRELLEQWFGIILSVEEYNELWDAFVDWKRGGN
jgi:hypothetical protein